MNKETLGYPQLSESQKVPDQAKLGTLNVTYRPTNNALEATQRFMLIHALQVLVFAPLGKGPINFLEGTYDRRFPTQLKGGNQEPSVLENYSMEDLNRAIVCCYQFITRRDGTRDIVYRVPGAQKNFKWFGYVNPSFRINEAAPTGVGATIDNRGRAMINFFDEKRAYTMYEDKGFQYAQDEEDLVLDPNNPNRDVDAEGCLADTYNTDGHHAKRQRQPNPTAKEAWKDTLQHMLIDELGSLKINRITGLVTEIQSSYPSTSYGRNGLNLHGDSHAIITKRFSVGSALKNKSSIVSPVCPRKSTFTYCYSV